MPLYPPSSKHAILRPVFVRRSLPLLFLLIVSVSESGTRDQELASQGSGSEECV